MLVDIQFLVRFCRCSFSGSPSSLIQKFSAIRGVDVKVVEPSICLLYITQYLVSLTGFGTQHKLLLVPYHNMIQSTPHGCDNSDDDADSDDRIADLRIFIFLLKF